MFCRSGLKEDKFILKMDGMFSLLTDSSSNQHIVSSDIVKELVNKFPADETTAVKLEL